VITAEKSPEADEALAMFNRDLTIWQANHSDVALTAVHMWWSECIWDLP
jgi:hypothetical protein